MTNKSQSINRRQKYSPQFKEQALERAEKDGVVQAARDLGIDPALIYTWRKKRNQTGISFEDQKLQDSEVASLKRQVARLSEENAFLKKVATYFTKDSK